MTKDTIWFLNAALWVAGYVFWTWADHLSLSALTVLAVIVVAVIVVGHVSYRLITGRWAEPAIIQEVQEQPIDDLAILTSQERGRGTTRR